MPCNLVGTSTGAVAIQQVEEIFDVMLARSSDLYNDVQSLRVNMQSLNFPGLSLSYPYDYSGQLETWQAPPRPQIDAELLEYNTPQRPNVDNLTPPSLGEEEPTTALPRPFEVFSLVGLIQQIHSLMDGNLGLPIEWETGVRQRASDTLWREFSAQSDAIRLETSRAGWSMPIGVELGRIDRAREAFAQTTGNVQRDIALQLYQEQLANMRLGTELGTRFLGVWLQCWQIEAAWVGDKNNRIGREFESALASIGVQTQVYQTDVQAESSRIAAVSQAFGAEAQVYSAEAGISDSISRRDAAAFGAESSRRTDGANLAIQNHQALIQARARDIQEQATNYQALASSLTGTLVSLHQALNASARVGSTMQNSNSSSCSESFSSTV